MNPIISGIIKAWNSLTKPKPTMPTPYTDLYNKATIRPERQGDVRYAVTNILRGKARYEAVVKILGNGMPWYVLGIIHCLEAANNFNHHPHNGDPLTSRTTHVPKGRPKADPIAGPGKPYSWEESAVDALRYTGFDTTKDWSIENTLKVLEGYNGWGYKKKGLLSPYLFSFTNLYSKGKYVKDGIYDPNAVSKQPGAVALMKALGV